MELIILSRHFIFHLFIWSMALAGEYDLTVEVPPRMFQVISDTLICIYQSIMNTHINSIIYLYTCCTGTITVTGFQQVPKEYRTLLQQKKVLPPFSYRRRGEGKIFHWKWVRAPFELRPAENQWWKKLQQCQTGVAQGFFLWGGGKFWQVDVAGI